MSIEEARARFAACGTLAEAILVGLRLAPAWSVVDVIVQDEFTHDVVMANDGGAGPAIVLDCT